MSYKNLVIVESPAKAKTIEKYLGKNYKVVASKGHVRDLPKSRMGIDFENDYEPDYITIRGKGPVVKELKRLAKKAENVYLASDPDREGEAIAWHISHILNLDSDEENRVVFHEITRDAVKDAFKSPRKLDDDLVDSQQARRILDRIVGYEISPILWKKIKSGLSAGRVQSLALKTIVDREKEIRNFKPEEYWSIPARFKKGRRKFDASFIQLNGKKKELKSNEDVKEIMSLIDQDKEFDVTDVVKSERKRNPYSPYKTSTMQQDAAHRINFRTGKTMMIAQQLYEGIKTGRAAAQGLITYMRTDSTRISPLAKNAAAEFIIEEYGEEYSQTKPAAAPKQAGAQDAHEAIRPTDVTRTPESIKKYLTADQYKLYALIWSRFIASQMTPAVFDTVKVDIEQNGVTFRANGSQMKFDGFTKVYKTSSKKKDNILPELKAGDQVQADSISPEQHFTQPPARFTEAALIKWLEENGVGRPSTYAPTIETLRKRYYVQMVAKRFEPTELGEAVNDLVSEAFPELVDVDFTVDMENNLDDVEKGEQEWKELIDNFYRPFHKKVEEAEENIEEIEIQDEPAGFDCEKCGSPMVIKMGRYGKFYACSNFPDCRNTQAILKKIGVTCPECGKGEVVERKTKKGRIFWGCERYPDCEFSSWDKPVGRDCPKCEHFLVEKKKRGSKNIVCPDCDYEEVPEEEEIS